MNCMRLRVSQSTSGFRPDVSVLNSSIGEIGPMFQDVISVTIDSFILPELTRKNDVTWLLHFYVREQ